MKVSVRVLYSHQAHRFRTSNPAEQVKRILMVGTGIRQGGSLGERVAVFGYRCEQYVC